MNTTPTYNSREDRMRAVEYMSALKKRFNLNKSEFDQVITLRKTLEKVNLGENKIQEALYEFVNENLVKTDETFYSSMILHEDGTRFRPTPDTAEEIYNDWRVLAQKHMIRYDDMIRAADERKATGVSMAYKSSWNEITEPVINNDYLFHGAFSVLEAHGLFETACTTQGYVKRGENEVKITNSPNINHFTLFMTIMGLVGERNFPVPMQGLAEVLGMPPATFSRTVSALLEGGKTSYGGDTKLDPVFEPTDDGGEKFMAKGLGTVIPGADQIPLPYVKEAVKKLADGGRLNFGLIKTGFVSGNDKSKVLYLSDKGLVLAKQIKEVLSHDRQFKDRKVYKGDFSD